jgi:hypothetical protein
LTAALYLLAHIKGLHLPKEVLQEVALGFGIFCPALAATLAAIRAQGEFVQLETRYKGMQVSLEDLRVRFAATLRDAEAHPMPLLSWRLANYTKEAAAWMLDEVSQWRGLLHTREIEI